MKNKQPPAKQQIQQLVTPTKPALTTTLHPKDEALRAAKMFFDRFSGIVLRPPFTGESATQYRSYVTARIQPLINNFEGIKKVILAATQS